MKSLHAAGHHITLVSPFPSPKKMENFTHIDSRFDTYVYVGRTTLDEFQDLTFSKLLNVMIETDFKYCYDVMQLPQIQVRHVISGMLLSSSAKI